MKLIVAVNNKNVIGANGEIPWVCKEDLRHFYKTTVNNIIIMGRKTYESVGSLNKRYTIVLSSTPQRHKEDTFFATNIGQACITAEEYWKKYPEKKVYVVGGSFVYESFLSEGLIDEIILTHVNDNSDGDAFFEVPDGWKVVSNKDISKIATIYTYRKG